MRTDIRLSLREALGVKVLDEVSDDIYGTIQSQYPNSRIIMSYEKVIDYRPTTQSSHPTHKPSGLWYAIGTEWIDWVKTNSAHWIRDYAHVLDIDDSRLLRLSNYADLIAFTEKYGQGSPRMVEINWAKVAEEYGGIEIAPYIHKARMEVYWYYSWDIASGCIWGDNIIIDSKKIQ